MKLLAVLKFPANQLPANQFPANQLLAIQIEADFVHLCNNNNTNNNNNNNNIIIICTHAHTKRILIIIIVFYHQGDNKFCGVCLPAVNSCIIANLDHSKFFGACSDHGGVKEACSRL